MRGRRPGQRHRHRAPRVAATGATTIDESADERLDDYRDLRDADARRAGFFVAESELVVRRLLASDCRVRSVLVTPKRLDAIGPVDAPVYVVAQDVLNDVVGFDLHRGVLASADRPGPRSVDEVVRGAGSLAVLEGITDHENLGVIFRNAAALGVGAVVLDPTCCDPLYRRTVRVSMGHVLDVPWARADRWPGALDDVRRAGFEIVATTPSLDAEPIDRLDPVPERPAVLLGTEAGGLSDVALAHADRRVRIAMAAGVDSLNVAAAAAIAFHRLVPRPRG